MNPSSSAGGLQAQLHGRGERVPGLRGHGHPVEHQVPAVLQVPHDALHLPGHVAALPLRQGGAAPPGGQVLQHLIGADAEILRELPHHLRRRLLGLVGLPLGHQGLADPGLHGGPGGDHALPAAELQKPIIKHKITPFHLCTLTKFPKFIKLGLLGDNNQLL